MYKLIQKRNYILAECNCGALIRIPTRFSWTVSLLGHCPICHAVSDFHNDVLPLLEN